MVTLLPLIRWQVPILKKAQIALYTLEEFGCNEIECCSTTACACAVPARGERSKSEHNPQTTTTAACES